MLLRAKTRKMQLGGSLNLAKNEAAKVDITWKQFDTSSAKDQPLELTNLSPYGGRGGGSGTSPDGGIPSDIAYVNNQIDRIRTKISSKLAGAGSDEYQGSKEFKNDSDELAKWAERLPILKSREENYKATRQRLQKSTGDDYAMYNGKMLVKDNANGGAYTVTDVNNVLTARIKTATGGLSTRYTPATVGEALDLRYQDETWSGFRPEGMALDAILSGVQDAGTVEEDMNKIFQKVGSVDETKGTFISSNGKESSLTELLTDLESAKQVYVKGTTKTNQANLEYAIGLFKNNLMPSQQESLRGKAVAQFIAQHGNKDVSGPAAQEWIEAKVNEEIANRAMTFLKISNSKTAAASKTTGTGEDTSKLSVTTNKIDLSRMGSSGKYVTIESAYNDAEDLKDRYTSILASVPANPVSINDAVKEGAGKDGAPLPLSTNPFINRLTGNELLTNLFLPDEESTPVRNVNPSDGLNAAIVNPFGGPMQTLMSVPYTVEQDGRKKIAWKEVKHVMDWGKKYKALYDEKMKSLGRDPKKGERLTPAESAEILSKVEKELGKLQRDPNIKVGDFAMVPIMIHTRNRRFDEDLENVMSSNLLPEEKRFAAPGKFADDDRWYKTFAFSLLPDGPGAFDPERYGAAMKLDKPMTAKQILESYGATARVQETGWDPMATLLSTASLDVTK